MADKKKEKKVKGLGNLYTGKMYLKRREWRGFADTMYDFGRWLRLYGLIMKELVFKCPVQLIKALFRYRWMATYATASAFLDRHTIGLRGIELKLCHLQFYPMMRKVVIMIRDILLRDENLNGKSKRAAKLREKTVMVDEMMPNHIFAGFPNLLVIPIQMIPVFVAGEMDQQANLPYIDAIEQFGLAPDVCPLPACELGCSVVDEYPRIGNYFISSAMPCDGSTMATMFEERYFKVPTFQITPPVRFNEPEVQTYAVKNLKNAIKWLEEQTGETFDWDNFFKIMKRHNQETEFMLKKWDVNTTDYPQICGPALALHRMFEFQVSGSFDPYFLKMDEKVFPLMMKGYEKDKAAGIKPKYRAIVWSCPSHYYSNYTFWAQNCWGIKTLVDMECMLSHHFFNTEDKELALIDMAKSYERMTMRSHTNGGYVNVLDECWKMCRRFNANIVIMYAHVSCKTMAGLQGLFEDQAREHGIHLIWVEHDLCDRRTVSRKEMRSKVNRYMQTVFQAEPVDPTLVDYEDDITW